VTCLEALCPLAWCTHKELFPRIDRVPDGLFEGKEARTEETALNQL
jgi:hypothetical protein